MPEISLPLSNLGVLSAFLCSSRTKISMQKEGVLSINVDHEKQPCHRSPPTGKVMNKELFLPAEEKDPLRKKIHSFSFTWKWPGDLSLEPL